MKALKRFLVLALALVMSLSLFACGNPNNNENPNPDTPVAGETIEKNFVIDYQITENGVISLPFTGDAPASDGLTYQASAESAYPAYFTVNGSNLDVELEGTMIVADYDQSFFYETATNKFVYNLKMNPVTDNYFVIDGAEETFKVATTVKATDVKFNGQADVAGITVADDGISFAKSVFEGKMGHNKLEYTLNGDTFYTVSVCAVTTAQLSYPITFEDGKISPFISIFGRDYKVVEGNEIEDADVKARYTGEPVFAANNAVSGAYMYFSAYTSSWRPSKDEAAAKWTKNAHALEIDHKAGASEMLKMFVSTKYLQGRMANLQTLTEESGWTWPGDAGANGYKQFFDDYKEDAEMGENRGLGVRVISAGHSTNLQFYLNIAGKDVGFDAGTFGSIASVSQNVRITIDKGIYEKIIGADGKPIVSYYAYYFTNATENCKLYIDDIYAWIGKYSSDGYAVPIPGLA